jgi:hypothetical protein
MSRRRNFLRWNSPIVDGEVTHCERAAAMVSDWGGAQNARLRCEYSLVSRSNCFS